MEQVLDGGAKQPKRDVCSRDFATELSPEAAGRNFVV
jgi:hypothetical protein